jgi:hypothetical protein
VILFFGIPSESPMRLAIEAARRQSRAHAVLSQREMHFADIALDLAPDGVDGLLEVRGERYELERFRGVYARIMDVATLPGLGGARRRSVEEVLSLERAAAFQEIFLDWLELTRVNVVSRPSAMASNASKPYQTQLIERCGLPTPPTVVTNDPAVVRAFASEHGRVVYKSTSGARSIVRLLDSRALGRLPRVRVLPTQFQAYVPGVDVRVHVVGEDVHATEVRSEAVDYRYGAEPVLSPLELPAVVADRCRATARALDLPLCGLDLRRTPAGEYVCFEANPMPAYAYYQLGTGQPIADSLVSWLWKDADGVDRRELGATRRHGARDAARSGAP